MSMINNKQNTTSKAIKAYIQSIFMLIFPDYELMYMPNMLVFNKYNKEDGTKQQGIINNDNYEQFKNILKEMFCLQGFEQKDYNPANKLAEQIANKFKQRHKKLSKKQGDSNKPISILSRYISILVIGNHHTIPELMQYTVYQLFDQFRRYQKKFSYDVWFQAKIAGAENLQDVDNWMGDDDEVQSAPKPHSNRIEF